MGPEDEDTRTDEEKAADAERVRPGPESQVRREEEAENQQQDD